MQMRGGKRPIRETSAKSVDEADKDEAMNEPQIPEKTDSFFMHFFQAEICESPSSIW